MFFFLIMIETRHTSLLGEYDIIGPYSPNKYDPRGSRKALEVDDA